MSDASEKIEQSLNNTNAMLYSDSAFSLPELEDFYIDDVPMQYLKAAEQALSAGDGSGTTAAFYIENPPSLDCTYHSDQKYFVFGVSDIKTMKADDGDTVNFNINNLIDNSSPFTLAGKNYNSFLDYVKQNANGKLSLRFLGENAPEIVHYTYLSSKDYNTVEAAIKDVKNNADYLLDSQTNKTLSEDTKIKFYVDSNATKGKAKYYQIVGDKYVNQDKTISQPDEVTEVGMKLKDEIDKIIKQAEDVRVIIDAQSINRAYQNAEDRGNILAFFNKNAYASFVKDFNSPGQDIYDRFLGVVYLKVKIGDKDTWINLSKYMIAKGDLYGDRVNPTFSENLIQNQLNSFVSTIFNMDSYQNYKRGKYVDMLNKLSGDDMDDRSTIQQNIFNMDFEALKDYTVSIGDCTFIVPPTSIRMLSQTTTERQPLLRARGSLTKAGNRVERIIEMTLYFNEDGINGIPYETTLPNNNKITYYMNGLRSLISQFKFTPFLPIENNHINATLGIEAVSLRNIQITTMPGFPKCLAATLTLEEFNYHIYMPELPAPTSGEDQNMFAKTICFKLMRYYYQRAILKGQDLSLMSSDSENYIAETMGGKTALQPMKFDNSKLNFYIADKNYLEELLQTKLAAIQAPLKTVPTMNDDEKKYKISLGQAFADIMAAIENTDYDDSSKNIVSDYDRAKTLLTRYRDALIKNIKSPLIKGIDLYPKNDYTNSNTLYLDIGLNFDNLPNGYQSLQTISKNLVPDAAVNDVFDNNNNNSIKLGFTINPDGNKVIILDKNSAGYRFLLACNNNNIDNVSAPADSSELDQTVSEYLLGQKQNIDVQSAKSIKFVNYDVGDIVVTSMAAMFGNNFTKMNLEAFDGFAPQFSGGQDTVLEIKIQTKDKYAAMMLTNLPKLSTQFARDFRLVLNCWPLRIDSDLTRFLGINEVVIDSVSTDTIPNMPGGYDITLKLVSVDRTLRNRESLVKLSTQSNAGADTITGAGARQVKTFFNLKESLQKVELYPDLELPTISELEEAGFKFLRYSAVKNNRTYVDPDFYFVYGHILGYQVFRDSILNTFNSTLFKDKNNMPVKFNLEDKLGNAADIDIVTGSDSKNSDNPVYKISNKNESYNNMQSQIKNIKDTLDKAKAESIQGIDYDKNKNALSKEEENLFKDFGAMDLGLGWHIGDKVKTRFGEAKYAMKNIDDASNVISKELKIQREKIIKLIDDYLSTPISGVVKFKEKSAFEGFFSADLKDIDKKIKDAVKYAADIVSGSDSTGNLAADSTTHTQENLYNALICSTKAMKSGDQTKIRNVVSKLLYAAACSATGQTECDRANIDDDYTWKPAMYKSPTFNKSSDVEIDSKKRYIPVCKIRTNNQGDGGVRFANDVDEALTKDAFMFGPFGIKTYTKDSLIKLGLIDKDNIISSDYVFLDPYYMKATPEELRKYKLAIMYDAKTAAEAFLRNCLVWTKKMLEDNLLISLYDLMWGHIQDKLEALSKKGVNTQEAAGGSDENKVLNSQGNYSGKDNSAKTYYKAILESIEKDRIPLACGKFLPGIVMMVVDNDVTMYNVMKMRAYDNLNGLTSNALLPTAATDKLTISDRLYRKFVKALYGAGLVESLSNLSDTGTRTIQELLNESIGSMVIVDRSNDPAYYVRDSFLDMIQNDKRGRMLRAFPTFYMMFIDEGRRIGYWKLHDNFYNMSAISEINVVKSRKIAADTAHITMSNMFNTYTEYDEDVKEVVSYDIGDVFDSVFSPRIYFMKEEQRRANAQPTEKTKLAPGVRMSIRMGYGADASTLPVVFNGSIAEVNVGEVVDLVAQGDGVELVNPILSDLDAEELQFHEEFSLIQKLKDITTFSATPRTILCSLLTSKGSWIRKKIREFTNGRFFNDNIYGITHFGEMDYKDIFPNGEVCQNIFEASPYPSWAMSDKDGGFIGICKDTRLEDAPRISFHVMGKSFWDIMNICQSVQPDYITSIVPFGLRSTVFYGAPRYYYAYDYIKDKDGFGEYSVKEKRKPFQQYHIYTSYSDIIENSIATDEKQVRTCAIGLYNTTGWLNRSHARMLDPMWVDYNIFPEKQKTMQYDTQYLGKANAAGVMFPFLSYFEDKLADSEGAVQSPTALAWRMTANALKDAVKDMYAGDISIIGDPSVKPHDRVSIADLYNNVNGSVLAEAVVHNFSVDTGYITTIYPDCIACVDDRYEQATQHLLGAALSKSVGMYAGLCASSFAFFGAAGKTYMTALLKGLLKGGKATEGTVNTILNLIGKDNLYRHADFMDKIDKVYNAVGINPADVRVKTYFENLATLTDKFKLNDKSPTSALASKLQSLKNISSDYDSTSLINKLENDDNYKKLKNRKDIDKVNNLIDELKNADVKNTIDNSLIKEYQSTAKGVLSELNKDEVLNVLDDDSKKIIKELIKKSDLDLNDMNSLGKILNSAGSAINKDIAQELVKNAAKSEANLASLFAKNSKGFASLFKSAGALEGAYAVMTAGGVAFTMVSMAVEFGITYLISACVQESILRFMRNLQAIQVYPIFKNGKPLSAGLNGSTGAVIGAPPIDSSPTVKDLFESAFQDHEGYGKVFDVVRNFFVDKDEAQKIVNTWRQNNNFTNVDTNTGQTNFINSLLKAMASDEIKNLSGFHSALMQSRIQSFTNDDGKIAFKEYYIGTEKYKENTKITENLVPVLSSKQVQDMKANGYLKIRHELPEMLNSKTAPYSTYEYFKVNTTTSTYPCIHYDKDTIVDIPFLRPDAFALLSQILTSLENYYAKNTTRAGDDNELKKHPIIIESCTRLGDKTSWASTGFMFKIQVTDCKDFINILKETKSDLLSMTEKNGNIIGATKLNGMFCIIKPQGQGYLCIVNPPKVLQGN